MRFVCAAAAVALAGAPAAAAGGNPVQLAAGGGAIWTCSDAGVIELDARSGRVLRRPVVGPAYPLQVALGSGAAWVAAVENGFTAGALTRIDLATGRTSTRLRLESGPVFAVAAGRGTVWALVGPTSHAQVTRVDPRSGRRAGLVRGTVQPSSLAADASGVWIADAGGRLLHARSGARRARTVLRLRARSAGPPALALGLGSAWASDGRTLLRVDERTTRTRARVRLPGTPTALAAGRGAVWAILFRPPDRYRLARVDARTGRVTAGARIPAAATSLTLGAGGVWLGVSGRAARVLRVDPRTLRLQLLARLL